MMPTGKKAIVIGSGLSGLASAIRLKADGFEVDVFESAPGPGGKASEFRQDGFRFDAGPSLFTMPELVDELFHLAGRRREDYLSYHRLPVTCQYFFPDGTRLTAWSTPDEFARELAAKTVDSVDSVHHFLNRSAEIYRLTADLFMRKSLHKVSTFLSGTAFRALLNLNRLDTSRTMVKAIKSIFRDPKTIQLFSRYATYNGSNPYQAPATLNIIPHLEHAKGAFFPEGGMISISQALYNLAIDLGIRFHFNQPADRIVSDQDRVTAVLAGGKYHQASVIVSSIDIHYAYHRLLPDRPWPEKTLNQPKSSSALIFYWGMNQETPDLDLHTIFFSPDYEEEFRYLFDRFEVFDKPTVYVYISSKQNSADAPAGKENWFTMINVPHHRGQDWDKLIPRARSAILGTIESALGRKIRQNILTERVLDPRGIESRTGSYLGALYGNSSNNRFSAFLRHPNFSSDLKGLYFCGGSVHPGGGIPLVLLSAQIAHDLIRRDFDLS
ncbi:MAG: phytoene desaturase family protein [Bacteroidetes bacterium]|nr:phytoene desaturase family protein [Bacteroidota bacterium]